MISKYFTWSILVSGVGILIAFVLGMYNGGIGSAFNYAVIAILLGALEISISFDNAVVNAKVLQTMDDKWRHRFLTWGMVIAVFGMRLLFPLLIVSVAGLISPFDALQLAVTTPQEYANVLMGAHYSIAAFGGMFLLLVGLSFFLDADKDNHWLTKPEQWLVAHTNLVKHPITVVSTIVVTVMTLIAPHGHSNEVFFAGVAGAMTYAAVHWIKDVAGKSIGNDSATIAKTGLASFIYLEVLDSTFSFDGVIGAFALTYDMFLIAIGLGIGAMFVRSLTIMLVDKGTLEQYEYLEHGAFWAIIVLAISMILGILVDVPEWFIGGSGIAIIGLSVYSSIKAKTYH